MSKGVALSRSRFDAVLFDLDGVVARTATVHAAAWKRTFDEYLRARANRTGEPFQPFDLDADYRQYVDGRPRYDGVAAFLASRGISLPHGNASDPPNRETICGIGNRKNNLFQRQLDKHGADVFESTASLIRGLRAVGIKTAVFSASKNCEAVLRSAGITDLFDTKVDGVEAQELGLAGKPDSAVLLEAARRLGERPERVVIIEDAIAGVRAGRAGGFALVIGVNRTGKAGMLLTHGADVEVTDLHEVRVDFDEASGRSTFDLPSALARLDGIRQRMAGGRSVLFLDYDGTLTPIVERPEDAVLSAAMRATLRQLAGRSIVAIISGRDLGDVRQLVGIEEIYYAGSHGFELAGPQGWYRQYEPGTESMPALDAAERDLRGRLGAVDGARLERKRFAVAIHYRQVRDSDVSVVEEIVDIVRGRHRRLRKTGGKKVFELRPDLDWHKGKALLFLLDALGIDDATSLVLYIGDDETDEDAFGALTGRGIGIAVTDGEDRETLATFTLHDPGEVARFLETLSAEAD